MRKTLASAGALLSVGALALTGCTPNNQNVASSASGSAASDGVINVSASDTACKLSVTTAKAGKVTFKVKNEDTKVNEFYVLGSDGLRIISEVENIGPNLSRDLTVELSEGSYKTGEVHSSEFKLEAFQISNGAKEMLDEIVDTKITGEEETWSHTDLSDFQGNIDGARVAYEDVLPILKQKDPKPAMDIEKKFDAVQKLLNQHKKGNGFASYDELTKQQVRELSDAVQALSGAGFEDD